MKKQIFSFFLIIAFFIGSAYAEDGKKYGKKITLQKTTKISDILSNPEKYSGKTVRIEGTAIHVCKHTGRRMFLSSDVEGQKILAQKRDESDVVFPATAVGKQAVVQGEVVITRKTKEQVLKEMKEHEGDEDPDACTDESIKDKMVTVHIAIDGALIK